MAFDVKEYLENRKKNTENGNNTSSGGGGFDAQDYLIKRKLPKVGEYLNSSLKSWNEKNNSAINEFNTRFKENKYRGDASDWYTDFGSRINELRVDADNMKSLIEEYKDYLDEDFVSSVTKAFDSNSINYSQMVKLAADDKDYWSNWDTEDAYNAYMAEQKAQEEEQTKLLSYDLEGGKTEIEFWEDLLAPYTSEIASYGRNDSDMVGTPQSKVDAYQQRNQEFYMANAMTIEEAEAMLAEKKLTYSRAKRAQEAEQLASVANPESKNYDPAFAEKSQYKSTATDAWHSGITTSYGMGYKDLTYEYINGDEDFRAEVNNAHDNYTYDSVFLLGNGLKSTYESAGYDHMTEDEVALYNYYYNTSGKEKAEEYLDSIEEKLQTRYGVAMAEGIKGKPVSEYLFAVEAGLDQFASGMKNMFSSEDYIPASATQVASGIVREDLAGNGAKLPDWLGGASLGQVGYDVLNTTSNMLPSILTSTAVNVVAPGAGAVVGVGLMGTSAGGHAKAEMLNLGYSKEQANTYGIMVGAAEAGMEYLLGGITKLGGVLPDGITGKILSKVDNAIARTAIKVGGSMVSEGVEEGLQTVIDTWLKEAATGVDWDAPNVDEVLYSSLLGALSAFGLEGAGVVAGEVGTYQSGKTIRNTNGGVGKLQEIGSKFASDTVAYKIASKVNAQTDAYTIGRLLNEVNGTISEQNVTDIANGLMEKGMDSKTANKLAKQYQAILNNEMSITDEQVKILENLSPLADVLQKNIIGANTTVYQRTRAYSDLMGLANEVSNGKKGASVTESKTTQKATTNIFEQQATDTDIKRIASEVASGTRSSVSDTIKRNMDSKSNIAAGKLGVEGKYASSETGATRLASNKKKVNIVGIDSIEGKTLKLKLDDGSIVDADEIDFSSSDEALVYEAVTNMGVSANTAWEILKGYNPKSGQSGTIYAMGALEAYTYGHNGVKVDGMSQDGFSALLTPTQKNTANKLGDIDARAKVESQQKTIDKAVKSVRDEAKSKHKAIPRRKGETVFEGDRASLTELQESQLNVLEKVAEGLGVTFHIFKSNKDANGKRYYKMPNGKITSANGWYDPKTGEIWIDLYAGNDGQGTMIFTAAHELTHFIRQWSPAKFKVFADFLFEQYGKKGQDVNQLIRNQITKAANNGRSISWDEAYEEVIADSCETFLRDSKAAEKIAALREKDIGLANKIKSFLGQMLAKMRKVMAKLLPETDEGQMVAKMTDSIQKLYDLWTDALADAGTAYSTIDKNLMENGITVNSDTESASLMSVRYLLGSNQQQKVAEELATRFGVTVQEAKGWIDAETSLASIILNPKYSQYLDYTADENEEAIKSNSDYPQGTVDFSNICKKRRDFTEVMNRVLRNFPNHVFEATDLAKIRTIMSEEGMEVACGICYVEDRRQLDSIVAQNFIDSLALYRKGSKNKPDGTPFNANQLKAFKLIEGDTYTPSIYELISLEGRNNLKAKNPAMEEAWVKFNNARGMQSVRLLLNDAEYKRQILKYSPSVVKRKNDLGGLRIYSFSDMEMFHLIDIIQVITDSATVGLSLQGYTKVNEYARAVKDTGEKLNRSLIPKGDLGYHIENGKVVLDYDTVEGIDINHPDFFDNIDNPNVGNIVIGINATQIKAAMTSKFIDQIIPFHTGQSGDVLGEKGIASWVNYKDFQSERDLDTQKKSSHQINIYTEVINAAEAEGHPITNKVEFVNKFLEVCKKNNLIPRFSDFLNVDENGDFIYTEGYHKFLVDFKTFDQNTGEYLPQKPVKPVFDNEYITQLLKDYAKTQKTKDAKFTENMPKVLDRITNEIVKSDGIKFSDRDSDGNALSMEQQEFFKDSKVRDKKGNLLVLYHGTNSHFTVFDSKYSDDHMSFFLTDSQNVAHSYARSDVKLNPYEFVDEDATPEQLAKAAEKNVSGWESVKVVDSKRVEDANKTITDSIGSVISTVNSIIKLTDGTQFGRNFFMQGLKSALQHLESWSKTGKVFADINPFEATTTKAATILNIIAQNSIEVSDEVVSKLEELVKISTPLKPLFGIAKAYSQGGGVVFEVVSNLGNVSYEDEVKVRKQINWAQSGGLMPLYANITNPLVVETGGRRWNNIKTPSELQNRGLGDILTTREVAYYANALGYDGVIFKGLVDIGGYSTVKSQRSTVVVAFNSNQLKSTENKTPTNSPDIRYSDRYSYEALTSKPDMSVTVLSENAPTNRADVVSQAKKNAASIGKANKDGSVSVYVKDVDTDVILSKKGLLHGLDRRLQEIAPVTVKAGEILQNSIKINDLTPSKEEADASYVLIGAAQNPNGDLYIVRSVVNKFSNELDTMDVLYAINAKKSTAALNAPLVSTPNYRTTISISQLLDFVNRYFPDILPESVLRHYGHDSRPEGELGESALYSDRTTNAPTFYSHMSKVVDGIKLDKIGANSLVPFLKGKGVKNEEIKWSGIEAWLEGKKSITKEELKEFIAGSQLQIVEQMSDDEDYTRWSQYKLDGGSNYRELVFQLSDSTYSNNAMRAHWGDDADGVLAHARIQDFEVDGKKMLFIEELQSDWHNEGLQTGYVDNQSEAEIDKLKSVADEKFLAVEDYSVAATGMAGEWETIERTPRGAKLLREYREAQDSLNKAMNELEKKIPDAPFRNNYHEYVLKRLLRMAAEEGYDSIGWTPSQIQSDRWSDEFAEAYRIEYDQEMPKFLRKYGKKWGATVGKTNIETRGITEQEREWLALGIIKLVPYETEVWSMDIPDSMKESVLHEGQVLFSDRSPEAVSTRSLLANALETTAQNDIERNKLEQYKSKIDLIESEYEKLTKLKAEIKELSFAKGKRDTKAIKALQFQANQTANRINTYDRQLLNLESTTALKNVLQREKELARRKEAQKGKDALAKYKEKAAKTQRALMDKNTESRKKAIESRNKTEMRHKVKKVVSDLKELLFTESKDKHVPIGLQKSVAEALDIINMDTMGADERVAKYNEMIHKSKDPDIIAELTKSRDRIALQGENLSDKLTALKLAYAEIKNSDDPLIRDAHNEAIEDLIANTAEVVGNTSLRDMSYEQLEAVYDMYKAILATVRNANKLFKAEKQETITENSESVKKEVSAAGGHRDRVLKATKWLKKFGWNMLKPIYAMKLIGSDTLTRLYENVRKGEDTWAVDVNEAKDFFKETAKKYEYNVWDFEKQYKFADSAGHTFSLTLEQIMSLYAYSKRSQADKHLEFGGFIFDDSIEVTKKTKLGIPMKYEVNDANPYRLKKEDLAKIIDLLESQMPNVKGFVDEMQAYLSDVMGAKGNEISLAMYDIKLYKEQNYFPLKTARYFREFDPEKNGTPKIKNSGFSKKTVPQAGNPIILSNFMDVWANHVNDMSMYHAFVLPLEDFMRVYNYSSTAGGYDSVQQYIKNAYGSQANAYIETLMNDLNGGARSDPATDIISKGMSLFKKAAVFASASVVIQQPSAIARAMAYIDAKYFVDKPQATKHKETWAEVKKYAPVAIIKEMGYFDTNMGRSTVDWIKEEKTWRDKVDDIASKAPALADELAWCAIWKAVKREVASTTKLTVGSEAYLKMVGKRFTEVVTKTQVYDSVLSRSALMRSKDSGAKMVTAFMAEPTTSLNMVVDAIIEGKRGNKKFAKQAVGAVAASIILNSILVSLVTAARDDDEDETYLEKYLESLTAEMLDGFNPLTYIPLVKDGWSIMQGFDIERSDMSIWSDLWQSVENLFSDNKSGFEKTEGIVGSIASIFGLPAKNLMRDARAVYNLASTLLRGTPTTWAGVGDAVGGAVKDSIPLYSRIEKFVGADESKADKLYDAIVSGDQKQIDRVKGQYKDDKAIESAIRQGLRENDSRIKEAAKAHNSGNVRSFNNYIETIASEGHFDKKMVESAIRAEESAFNTKISQAAEAKSKGDDEEYKKIVRELRDSYKGIYSQDEIVELIKKEQEKPKSESNTDVASSIYKASDVNSAFESGDTEMALEVIEDLFNTKVANYLAEAKAEAEESGKRFNERTAQKEAETKAKSSIRSSMTTYWKPLYKAAYKAKDTAEQERIKRILKDSGMYGNAREVIETIREWRTERD